MTDLALNDCPTVPTRTSSNIRATLNLQRIKENESLPVNDLLQRIPSVKTASDQIQERIPVGVSTGTQSTHRKELTSSSNSAQNNSKSTTNTRRQSQRQSQRLQSNMIPEEPNPTAIRVTEALDSMWNLEKKPRSNY